LKTGRLIMDRTPITIKGRGAAGNPQGRFEKLARQSEVDEEVRPRPETVVTLQPARSIITRNDSPDLPFNQSINPYQGCEHGCIYCYARPSHAYLGLSPGLEFETRLFAKENAAELLRRELSRPGYRCELISLGATTDPYPPVEREEDMAREDLVEVFVSIGSLDPDIARTLEPRAAAPYRRVETIRRFAARGIPVGTFVAPIIPFLNDKDMEGVLEAVSEAGAHMASYTLLRLPWEVKGLFKDWLERHHPLKAKHVMARIRDVRGGRENDPDFGSRMRGEGEFAELLRRRFEVACRRLGLNAGKRAGLDCSKFRRPGPQQGILL
jgi:DNA repair photolyase